MLEPSLQSISIALIIALSIPLLLHLILYRSKSSTSLPTFLVIGPSNAGKTALSTLFERGQPCATHTSQSPLVIEVSLPLTTETASPNYRSDNDPSNNIQKQFLLIDTPGHSKLRHHALDNIMKPQNNKGILFVVDSANISTGSNGLREAAEYLHDVLLQLQNKSKASKSSKGPLHMPLLIAANKSELFTASKAPLVKRALEVEITTVRASRAKGLLDSGISMNDMEPDHERDWLGDGGEGSFEFTQMEGMNIFVSLLGGSVVDRNIADWWKWLGENL